MNIDVIQIATDLIAEQVSSLNNLKGRLGGDFIRAVDLVSKCKGRLIIIGLGKSGIIGRKIAATLSSTGTPSSFIHASDALHGDSGNINTQDIILFITKSGSTEELTKLLPLIKNMNLKIITMTGNVKSDLALDSDVILDVSVSKEACPNNLAPTTSTTMQLVMGDALSVSLLKIKNFTKADFAKFHPSGALGKRLNLTVEDVYDSINIPSVEKGDKIQKIILEISSKRLGATAVIQNGEAIGIITDGDLRRMLESTSNFNNIVAVDFMTDKPKVIQKKSFIYEAFSVMKKNNITQLIVVDKNKYLGIIHLHDILKHNIF